MAGSENSTIGWGGRISYAARWLPAYFWQRMTRPIPRGPVHLIIAMADHFEPAIVPGGGAERAPYGEQERRLERWCSEYPRRFEEFRDAEGRLFAHTYFYPAEQYERAHVERLADLCRAGWGEIEVHLHHGMDAPDSAEHTRATLLEFRDRMAGDHGCLSYAPDSPQPRYAFVHGNFALANSDRGPACGVDSEMQILAETGCYADMTLPAAPFHGAQVGKINSMYECGLPLAERAPHRSGRDLAFGRAADKFPIMVQGPLLLDFHVPGPGRRWRIENGAITARGPASVRRLGNWKRAAIGLQGRPDWVFIKLHCHGMDPTQDEAVLGEPMRAFVRELVSGAGARRETVHFVSAREMVNMILAACDGREGNPGEYRDYRFKRERPLVSRSARDQVSRQVVKG